MDAASRDLSDGAPLRRRTALFLIIDYYQTILVDAARLLGRDLRGGLPVDAMNVVFAAIPGFPEEEIRRLEELRPLRNRLAHDHGWIPEKRVVQAYIDRALAAQSRLHESAQAARKRLDSLSEIPRLFAEVAIDIRGAASRYWPDDVDVGGLLARADEIALSKNSHIDAADMKVFAQLCIAAHQANMYQEQDYEDMAMDAMADYYRGK